MVEGAYAAVRSANSQARKDEGGFFGTIHNSLAMQIAVIFKTCLHKIFFGRSYSYSSHPDGHNEPTSGRTHYRMTVSLEIRFSRVQRGADQDVS